MSSRCANRDPTRSSSPSTNLGVGTVSALALSGVRFRDYLVASIGMIPAIIMYVYYGKVAGDVTRIAAGVAPPRGNEYYVMLIVGLIATFAATHLIGRAAKKAMAEENL